MSFALGVGILLIGFALGWICCATFALTDGDDDDSDPQGGATEGEPEDWRHG